MLVGLLSVPLLADTRQVIKITAAGHETVYTEYVQGKNLRTENSAEDGSRRQITIQNFERKTVYEVDPRLREYVEWRPDSADLVLSLAQWIARPPATRKSGKIVDIYYETIDTGEEKQFFGRTAKHLVIRERRVAEPGACGYSYELQRDGWYVPRDSAGTAALLRAYAIIGGRACSDTVVRHGDPPLPGVPVFETDGSVTREILELSNDPLDKSVFDVPVGFRKVDALPWFRPMSWSERLEMEWSQLEHAFKSWFN